MCRYVRDESPIIRKTDGHTIFLSRGSGIHLESAAFHRLSCACLN